MPLVFNFGLPKEGYAICEFLNVDRLLRAGVRPQHLFVEILPPVMHNGSPADVFFEPEQLSRADLRTLAPYLESPARMEARWLEARVTPAYWQRLMLLSRWASDWVSPTGACAAARG